MLLRSEVLLNLLTQAEHSTGRKEAAILSGPIVWPPGLGNQTGLWPGCGSLSGRFWWARLAKGGKRQTDGLLMAFTLFSLHSITSFSWLRASGSQPQVSQPFEFLQGEEGQGREG